jgi:hypothetical protein
MCKYALCDEEASCGVSWQPSRLSCAKNVDPPPQFEAQFAELPLGNLF